jgi:hypothetical protein
MFLRRRGRPFSQLFVAASFALPDRKDRVGIAGALVNRPLRWNDFTTAPRTETSARRPLFNIEVIELALIFHYVGDRSFLLAGFAIPERQKENRAENRDRRHQQNYYTNIQVADETGAGSQRSPAHHTLGEC